MSPGMMEARRSHRRHSRSHRSLPQNTVLAPSLNMTVACIGLAGARNHQPCSLSAPDQELEDAGFTDCGQCVYVGPMDKFDPDKMFPDFDFDNVPVAILNCQKKELPGCLVRWTQTAAVLLLLAVQGQFGRASQVLCCCLLCTLGHCDSRGMASGGQTTFPSTTSPSWQPIQIG